MTNDKLLMTNGTAAGASPDGLSAIALPQSAIVLAVEEAQKRLYYPLCGPYALPAEREALDRALADLAAIPHCLVEERGGYTVWRTLEGARFDDIDANDL